MEGRSALCWAVVAGQDETVKLLLGSGGGSCRDRRGRTGHHLAAAHGQVNVLGALIEMSTKEVHQADHEGFTPIHYAAYNGQEGALEMLIQSEAAQVADPTHHSFSPLHCAVSSGSEHCLQLLVSHSTVLVNSADASGSSPLHIAAGTNMPAAVTLLLASGAELDAVNSAHRSPLMVAAARGHITVMELLQEAGADLEIVDNDGNSALHLSCAGGHSHGANLLLTKQISPDFISRQNQEGKSSLHLAAGQGLVDTTELLLAAGASVTCIDSAGNPPALSCARDEDTATCLAMILSVYLTAPTETRRSSVLSLGRLSSRRSELMSRLSGYLSESETEVQDSPQIKNNGSGEAGHNSVCSSDSEYF